MKALILVGGYGTRLRPLTLSVPKPLISFCNKTIVEHQIEALVKAGVKHVILAAAYQPDAMKEAMKSFEQKFQIKITCSSETEPLGTAGPIKLAESELMTPDDASHPDLIHEESFFVCNSDVICKFPLNEMKAFHAQHNREGTILVTKVTDPSKYGVVVSDQNGKIERFVEKPEKFVGDQINGGLYLLKKKVLSRIELRPTSIEREVFPLMTSEGQLYCKLIEGYWADIGQPKDYLVGMQLYLASLRGEISQSSHIDNSTPSPKEENTETAAQTSTTTQPTATNDQHDNLKECPRLDITAHDSQLACGTSVIGSVLIDPSAKVGRDCCIGPNVTVGAGCVIGDGVRLKDCAIMERTTISDFACLGRAIVGWRCRVGRWVRMEGLTVLGENVRIEDECFINGALILPHKTIASSIYDAGSIIM